MLNYLTGDGYLSERQRVVARLLTFVLVDLCVLNLIMEYTSLVYIASFTVSLLVAIVLQLTLRISMMIKGVLRKLARKVPGKVGIFLQILFVWSVSFSSKFVIFWILDALFGEHVEIYSVKELFVVLICLVLVENVIMRLFWSSWMVGTERHPA